jgi:hypothetical protein
VSNCTIPRLFGFKNWFDSLFADLCDWHDGEYVRGCPYLKFKSDVVISWKIAKRGYRALGILTLIYCTTLGSIYWIYRRMRKWI